MAFPGLYRADDEPIVKFKSIKLLVGEVKLAGSLLDNLESVFPNLEMIYLCRLFPLFQFHHLDTVPSAFLDNSIHYSLACNDVSNVQIDRNLQQINVGLNRFLKDISLPRLLPLRPISPFWATFQDFFPTSVVHTTRK